ncbi:MULTISPECIES: hypothetical protein [Aerococcus]|nr:hypothetical protein [Aerococcus urinae]MDK7302762.1 hypothetical protein [Aerococcus urinae]MDK7801454.1 hypothetical protein [Aerococcus urinae]MDK8655006.1 hypothetical protein [Aerococcus urinae]
MYYSLNRIYRQPNYPSDSQEYYLLDYSQHLNDFIIQHIMAVYPRVRILT